ncbi:hypothetical protein ACLI4Y_12135 [Natrialbaceae archaeon A-CW3]
MTSSGRSTEPSNGFTLKGGALGGVGAFIAGYVLTYLLVLVDSELEYTEESAAFELIGTMFYNAHFVDAEFVFAEGTVFEGTRRLNIIAEESTQFPEPVFYLVPVAILFGVGALIAHRSVPTTATGVEGAKAGASVVVGYLPLAVVGTVLFETTAEFEILGETIRSTFGPDVLMSIIFVGLVFPVVLGAVGGFLARQ